MIAIVLLAVTVVDPATVGPARLDYGFRLKRATYPDGSEEPLGQFHVVIGNAF